MLKPSKNPRGFENLLAYKKAEELQTECRRITRQFPKTKTLIDLADQMDRSARSGKQNIVEGWKRNTTKEYFDFLGFSIGAVAELEEDCGDIWKGRYPELEEIKAVMGEERVEWGKYVEREEREEREEGEEMGVRGARGEKGNIIKPIIPIKPFNPPFDIEKLRFYPLDQTLPPIVQLKLRAKELNYLLYKLQTSLETKMKDEKTLPANVMAREQLHRMKQSDEAMAELLRRSNLRQLEDGQFVSDKE